MTAVPRQSSSALLRAELAIAGLSSVAVAGAMILLGHPLVAPAAGLVPIAVVIAFRSAFLLCVAFVIFSFFRIHEAFPVLEPLKIPLLLAMATLAVLGWHTFITRQIKPFLTRELRVFLIFFGLMTVGVMFASNRPIAMAYWTGIYWKVALMTLAIAWLLREPWHYRLMARLLVAAGMAVAVVAIQNKLAGIGLVEGTRVTIGRDIGSVLGDPNDLALVLLFPLAFAIALVIYRCGIIDRLLGLGGSVLIIWAIIATQSRGGLLGILTVFGIFGLRVIKSKLLLTAIGVVALLGLAAVAGISERQSGGAHEEGIDESAMGRLYAWVAAWRMALANPVTGVGIDNFYSNFFFYSPHWDGKNKAVHSTWFQVLAEGGFLGLIVFVLMIAVTVGAIRRAVTALHADPATAQILRASATAVLAGLAGFCVAGTFLTQAFTWPLYILIAITASLSQITSNKIKI
jgi:putative inorganic carbon (hco3(-)) transporter